MILLKTLPATPIVPNVVLSLRLVGSILTELGLAGMTVVETHRLLLGYLKTRHLDPPGNFRLTFYCIEMMHKLLLPRKLEIDKVQVMGRSGKLVSTNDGVIILMLIDDPNYRISQTGEITTLITRTGKRSVHDVWRVCGFKKNGYVCMRYRGVPLQVGRVVYQKYLGDLEDDLVVLHVDGNTENNDINNLKLVTQGEANLHRFRVLKHPPVIGNSVLNWGAVRHIREMKAAGKTYSYIRGIYPISKGHVSQIVNNKIWIEGKDYVLVR